MSEKRAFIVTTAITNIEGKLMQPTSLFFTDKGEARAHMGRFQADQNETTTPYIADYLECIEGECQTRKVIEDGNDIITKTGARYAANLKKIEIDTDELQNLTTDYEVMVEVIRRYTIEVLVYEAEDEDDAERMALEQIGEGNEESSFDYPDDEDCELQHMTEVER